MIKFWNHLFLEERPSLGLSFFRIAVALTTGFHVIPTFFCLKDNYFHTAFKTFNYNFFPASVIQWIGQSPDSLVVFFVVLFCLSWLFFLLGLFSQVSCIVMVLSSYYFYALNSFQIGTLSWDILLVTLFLMCLVPYHGDYFSLDALRTVDPLAYQRKRPFFIQALLQMQVAFSYFYTGLYKVTGPGNWLTGNPMHYLMNYPPEGVMKYFLLKDYLATQPALCYAIGLLVLGVELAMPFLLYYPKTRMSAIYLGFLFHVTLILTMDVPAIFFFLFPAQLLLFVPPENVVRWVDQKRLFNQKGRHSVLVFDGHCPFCRMGVRQLKIMDLFDTLSPVDYHDVKDIGTIHPQLTQGNAESQWHLVESDGTLYGGFFVFRRLCLNMPMLYPLIPVFYFPGAGIAGPVLYRWVSRNRYALFGHAMCQDNVCLSTKP